MVFSRDKQGNFIQQPFGKTLKHLFYFVFYLLLTGALQSVMAPYPSLAVFGEVPTDRMEWFSLKRFLSWQLYANNVLYGGKLFVDQCSFVLKA
jgi:Na+/melibiose symporter-like transporter